MGLWIVGQIKGEYKSPEDGGTAWEFQGVFDNEEKAIDACKDENYWIAPIKLNEEIDHSSVHFSSAYYPKRK